MRSTLLSIIGYASLVALVIASPLAHKDPDDCKNNGHCYGTNSFCGSVKHEAQCLNDCKDPDKFDSGPGEHSDPGTMDCPGPNKTHCCYQKCCQITSA